MDNLTELGIGATLAILIVREFGSFAKGLMQRKNGNGINNCRDVRHWVEEMHSWMGLTDAEGVRMIYVRRSFEEALRHLADTVEALRKTVQELDTKRSPDVN